MNSFKSQVSELPGMPEAPQQRNRRYLDYVGLFADRVMPTGHIDVLERHGHLLFIKSYADGQHETEAQRRIWKLLVRHGETLDAPGSITVACVWGLGDSPRQTRIYDYQSDHPTDQLTRDTWREWLRNWWVSH